MYSESSPQMKYSRYGSPTSKMMLVGMSMEANVAIRTLIMASVACLW